MEIVASQLKNAIRRKGWSISQTAEECEVDRSFLSRLLGGGSPPRVRSGRLTAEVDERYQRLADKLALDDPDSFIEAVVRAQRSTAIRSPQRVIRRTTGSLQLPEDFKSRYSRFSSIIAAHQPLKSKADLRLLLFACVEDVDRSLPFRVEHELSELDSRSRTSDLFASPPHCKPASKTHDYLGTPPSRSCVGIRTEYSPRTMFCRLASEALERVDYGDEAGPIIEECMGLALMFDELAAIAHAS